MGIFSADSWLNAAITSINNVIWSYFIIAFLVICGLYFTW